MHDDPTTAPAPLPAGYVPTTAPAPLPAGYVPGLADAAARVRVEQAERRVERGLPATPPPPPPPPADDDDYPF